jgi:MFS family permease
MFLNLVIQIQWLTHAAVARPAEVFYAGQFNPDSFFNIDFLAMAYMLVFLIMSFPASYIVDTYGIRIGLIIGAVLTGIFSISKAYYASDFQMVAISQIGLAFAQPFILNAGTAVSVRWFPLKERAMAAGLSALAQYIGIIIAMLVTPLIVSSNVGMEDYGSGFEKMLWIYGLISVAASILLIIFIRERPKNIKMEPSRRYPFFKGIKHILSQRDMLITILLFLIGLGIFNAVSSMTDSISEYAGIEDSDGLIGGLMLIGGIFGAIILPTLSDKYQKRKFFLVLCMIGMVPGIFGLTYAHYLTDIAENIYTINLVAAFILGFFVMSAGPIGFQYSAEISYPAPESASQGILLWIGQISGMLFVALMSTNSNQYLGTMMRIFSILSIVTLVAVLMLKESKLMSNESS